MVARVASAAGAVTARAPGGAGAIVHVVFDVGRTLIHWDPELPYLRLLPDARERAWFLSEVCGPEWIREQDRGRPWREGEDLLVARYPQHEALIRAYRRVWPEMVPHAVPGSVEVLRGLVEGGIDVTLLTNFAADTFAEACRMHPYLGLARGATVSGEVGVLKPEAEAYRLHAEGFALDPSRTVLVDDTEENLTGAQAAGWDAVRFVDAATMRADLAERGLPA